MELAAKFFEATLAARAGAKARGYLADRGLDAACSSSSGSAMRRPSASRSRSIWAATASRSRTWWRPGCWSAGDDIPVPYDRFRDRVMFPIADLRGRVIAFGGRALEKDVPAKYLNSPETPLFHKGSNLYNGATARQAAHDGATVIAVEGYVDVIAMVMAGFPATVAPLGTALTEDQLGLLWKMADEPVLCFDGDKARRARRLPRARPGAAAAQARQEPEIRAAAGRPGPRRSGALGRARGGGRGHRRRAAARRHAVGARDRGAFLRHAGAARGAGGAHRRDHHGDRRRVRAALLSAGLRRPPVAVLRPGASPARRTQRPWRRAVLARDRARGPGGQAAKPGASGAAATPSRDRAPARGPRPMWSSASSLRRARCIAAIAWRCRGARRSFCRRRSTIPGCCTTTWRNSARSSSAIPTPSA